MTTTQVVFSIALAGITVVITGFALYVASSTMWGGRWYRRRRPVSEHRSEAEERSSISDDPVSR